MDVTLETSASVTSSGSQGGDPCEVITRENTVVVFIVCAC